MEERKITLGGRIKLIRISRGLSQNDFGNMLDTSGSYISMVEKDKEVPSGKFIKLISLIFNVPLDYLNNGTKQDKSEDSTASPLPFTELDESVSTLGERIKQIRKIYGLSQTDFAESLGVSVAYISKIEKGIENASDTLLKLISCKFNVSFEYLKTGRNQDKQEYNTAATPSPEEPDATDMINMILNAEAMTERKDIQELLENNQEWEETRKYINDQFEKLKTFVVCISGNPENGKSVGRLENSVSNMQEMWGNACFLAGLKKGLLLMQWAKGEAKAKEVIL